MDHQIRLFRLFIASPSDLGDERRAAREIVEDLNAIWSKETDLRIELLGWEDTLPGTGRPQALINADLDKADLFIGCLWQKMGSPSGITGKTGFEEEFERALARNKGDGTPEMWLFLKEVDAVRAADPGEQLRRVLEFKKEQEQAKHLLFKEFKDVSSWRELLRSLLIRRLLQAVAIKPVGTKEEQTSGVAPSQKPVEEPRAPKADSEQGEVAFSSLAELLELAGKRVRSKRLLAFDRKEALPAESSARLLLFAATNYDWNSQHIEFGAHEINSMYLHREGATITSQERLFLLRTILLDTFQTKPGWYWIHQWRLPPKIWLSHLAMSDSEDTMRLAAVQIATRMALPLHKGKRHLRPIDRILKDTHSGVRVAGLTFLGLHGAAGDEATIRALLADPDKEVRIASERALRTFHLRLSPGAELKRCVREKDTFDEALVEILQGRASLLENDTLFEAMSHPSGALRTLAARELLSRSLLTKEIALQFTQDEARAVRQCGYTFLAATGETLNLEEVKTALKTPYLSNDPSWNKADSKPVISAAFERLTDDELWAKIVSFNEESAIAMQIIGSRLPVEKRKILRELIGGGLDSLAAKAKALRPAEKAPRLARLISFWGPSDPVDAAKEDVETVALEVLADTPASEDRSLFLGYLARENSKVDQIRASLRGLATVGTSDDRLALSSQLESNSQSIERQASETFLALSTTSVAAANELLSVPTKTKVWSVVSHALKATDREVWAVLEPLLKSEDEDIRRIVAYFAVRTQSRKQLTSLLERYPNSGRYFYNVIVMIDRELYAPRDLAALFLTDEEKAINNPGNSHLPF